MAPRSSWKGYIRLSLVSIPVKAYTATASGGEIRLNQLHRDCNSPIKYRKVCPTHGELESAEIVSGYQYAKGQYVVIDPEEVSKLRKQSDKAVNLDGFFPADKLDLAYLTGKNYYLAPDGPVGQKAYVLLHKVMTEKNLYGIAQVILSGKEQLVVLRTTGRLLVMSGLNYEAQVKSPAAFEDEVIEVAFSADEVKLTETLIEATTLEKLDLSRYKNAYVEKLTELIEARIAGKQIVAAPHEDEPKVIELMEALKQSVARIADVSDAAPEKKTSASTAKKKMAQSTGKKNTTGPKKKKLG